MPQTASAKKALRVSERRRAINDHWRGKLHATERKFKKALTGKNADEASALFVQLQSTLDRMARRHILHRNTAARTKSRFAAKITALSLQANKGTS